MARRVVDIRDLDAVPAWQALLDEVQATNRPLTIRGAGEELAVIAPAHPRRRFRKGEATSADDPIWRMVGTVSSEGPEDVALHHDEYLAEALRDTVE